MKTIKTYWLSLKQETRDKIISAVRTLGATFIACLFPILASDMQWSKAFLITAITTALSSTVKQLLLMYAPHTLGGRKNQ